MTCTTCGVALATANVLYDTAGNVTCARCLMASESAAGHVRASMKVKSIAYGGPVLGIVGMFFNPFLFMSVAAVANGIYVLRAVRHPDTAQHLADSIEKVKVGAIAGIVLGAITAVLGVMNMAAK